MTQEIISKFLYKLAHKLIDKRPLFEGRYIPEAHLRKIQIPIAIEKVGSFVFAHLPDTFLKAIKENLMLDVNETYEELKNEYLNHIEDRLEREKRAEALDFFYKPKDEDYSFVNLVGMCFDQTPLQVILKVPISDLYLEKIGNVVVMKSEKISEFIRENNIYSPLEAIYLSLYDTRTVNNIVNCKNIIDFTTKIENLSKKLKKSAAPRQQQVVVIPAAALPGQNQPIEMERERDVFGDIADLRGIIRGAGWLFGFGPTGVPGIHTLVTTELMKLMDKRVVEAEKNKFKNVATNVFAIFGKSPPNWVLGILDKGFEHPMALALYRMVANMVGLDTPLTRAVNVSAVVSSLVMNFGKIGDIPADQLAKYIADVSHGVVLELDPLLEKHKFANMTSGQILEAFLTLVSVSRHIIPFSGNAEQDKKLLVAAFKRYWPLIAFASARGIPPKALAEFIEKNDLQHVDPILVVEALARYFGEGTTGADPTVSAIAANSAAFKMTAFILEAIRRDPGLIHRNPLVRLVAATYTRALSSPGVPYMPLPLLMNTILSLGVNPYLVIRGPVSARAAVEASRYLIKMGPAVVAEFLSLANPPFSYNLYFPAMMMFNRILEDPKLRRLLQTKGDLSEALALAANQLGIPMPVVNNVITAMDIAAGNLGVTRERFLRFIIPATGTHLSSDELIRAIAAKALGYPEKGILGNLFAFLSRPGSITPQDSIWEIFAKLMGPVGGLMPMEQLRQLSPEEFRRDVIGESRSISPFSGIPGLGAPRLRGGWFPAGLRWR